MKKINVTLFLIFQAYEKKYAPQEPQASGTQ